jgi:hypothetical protein
MCGFLLAPSAAERLVVYLLRREALDALAPQQGRQAQP